jgi:2-polyprenyl-3-methyl-5-hydroxy-6-metoxy-1,4-benzoquinol methylase
VFVTRENCPACGNGNLTELCEIEFSHHSIADYLQQFYQGRIQQELLNDHLYTVCECQHCRLVFQQHILNDTGMELLYGRWISAEQSLRKRQQGKAKLFRKYAAECETIARITGKPPHQTRVIEFGMGWGYWSRMAAAFNYNVTGLELSSERIAHAQSMGVAVADDFSKIEPASADFIYANQVLEHVANPREIVLQLKKLLAPSGVLLIRVPNGRGIAKTLRGSGWHPSLEAIHPLEHINAFSRSCLTRNLQEYGLREVRAPVRLSANTPAHFWRSAKRELNDRFRLPHVYLTHSSR